ncbi:SIA1 [Candida pseudojiufengensis]|uniref:SIA1 n=1 Tax=Candida pseudojiufengensis TaxID=497109 RepID=UPI0022252B07|nr:SIA1 [Candida pseudojiufengensis]KAI5964087.1 SIA1 [Candida pseudojiufengensis]
MMVNRHYSKLIVLITASFSILGIYLFVQSIKPTILSQTNLLNYQLNLQDNLLNNDQIISDIEIFKCRKFSKNCDNEIPSNFRLIRPSLKYYESKSNSNYYNKDFYKFDYYLGIEIKRIEDTNTILEDLSLTPKDGYEEVKLDEFIIYKKNYILDGKKQIPKDLSIIRSIDILFGSKELIDSRPNYTTLHLIDSDKIHPIISFKKVTKDELIKQNELTKNLKEIKDNNQIITDKDKFKILQLSDLHFGQDLGRCTIEKNNKNEPPKCKSDLRTLKFISNILQKEKPDLIIITGDLIDNNRIIDYKSILLKSLQPIIETNIKFLYTFGDENLSIESKQLILKFLSTLPNCLNTEIYESNNHHNHIHGLTNLNYQIYNENFQNQISSITILDSQNHFIDDSQINYLYRINNNDQKDSTYKLLFFHHPIPQFRPEGTFKIIGSYNEKHNLDTKTNPKFHDDIINCKYNVVAVGHEHENDACILSEKEKDHKSNQQQSIWLCYNSVTGDSGKTLIKENYIRKMRLFEIDYSQKRILSWKRKEDDKSIFEPQLIYKLD